MTDPQELRRRIVATRAGGAVQRCHGYRHHGSYTNAEHQWGCAVLLYHLWPEDFCRLVPFALFHDVPEAWVGDLPAPIGKYLPKLKAGLKKMEFAIMCDLGLPSSDFLPEGDRAKLKTCDWLELYIWCKEQATMGNAFIYEIIRELDQYLQSQDLPPPADRLYAELMVSSVAPRFAGVVAKLAKEVDFES